MKKGKETIQQANQEQNIWYEVKFYHTQDSTCRYKGKSERIKFLTSSQAKLRVLVENSKGRYFCGQNCRKCGTEARITVN